LDADRGGMDRHPRLLTSVAAFTAPAEWPAAWSRCTTTGCAINSLSGEFAVGHNRGRNDIHVTRCKSVTDVAIRWRSRFFQDRDMRPSYLVCFETSWAGLRTYHGYGIASAHAIRPSKAKRFAMPR
jgi:hypothetical protein